MLDVQETMATCIQEATETDFLLNVGNSSSKINIRTCGMWYQFDSLVIFFIVYTYLDFYFVF